MDATVAWLLLAATLICVGNLLLWGIGAALIALGLMIAFTVWLVVRS